MSECEATGFSWQKSPESNCKKIFPNGSCVNVEASRLYIAARPQLARKLKVPSNGGAAAPISSLTRPINGVQIFANFLSAAAVGFLLSRALDLMYNEKDYEGKIWVVFRDHNLNAFCEKVMRAFEEHPCNAWWCHQ